MKGPFAKYYWLLTIVVPDQHALRFLADIDGLIVISAEVAFDVPKRSREAAARLGDFFDEHFVHPRHGNDQPVAEQNGSYTRRASRGVGCNWYWDRKSKVLGSWCFHFEVRIRGLAALRKVGISRAGDLVNFDHIAVLSKRLNLVVIDLGRLGRWYENTWSKSRRQKPAIIRYGRFEYDVDKRLGSLIYRREAETPDLIQHAARVRRAVGEFAGEPTDRRIVHRSAQRFIDVVGKGPFVRRLEWSPVNVHEHKLLPTASQGFRHKLHRQNNGHQSARRPAHDQREHRYFCGSKEEK